MRCTFNEYKFTRLRPQTDTIYCLTRLKKTLYSVHLEFVNLSSKSPSQTISLSDHSLSFSWVPIVICRKLIHWQFKSRHLNMIFDRRVLILINFLKRKKTDVFPL